ncbi:MAG: XRE family transcriptional regulator [Proteobacteria bacterium]|nr:XRE family transcriptional regulator [Pseudomonadota bacterium]MBU1584744.1 XRE family transcriptional regulator [Pseudomonadota bacterium]MBU2451878.1 XRE family transcriptional regulator [Pseudomonadota bacterium]MBU2629339.1 XRE family transcriptional regulator [Pseudomonadota bacterium]
MEKKDKIPHINVDYFEDLTGNIKNGEKGNVDEVGKRIKQLREERGISIEDLSNLTGFDISRLKDIEEGIEKPQLGTVMKLSKALDAAVGRLVSGIGTKLYSITRKNERKQISRSSSTTGKDNVYSYMSLAPEVQGRHMEALIVQLEKCEDKEISIHNGEEFVFVLEGVVNLTIGKDTYDLDPGDSAYYLSTTSHFITAKTQKATILAVLYE